jgi:hypothetical protein
METIFKIGGLAGLISVIWLIAKDLFTFFRRPRLRLLPFDETIDCRIFHYPDTSWDRKFINLHVENTHSETAINCLAVLTILSRPANIMHLERQYYLHWADVEYSARTTEAQPINLGRGQRRLDVVFSQDNQQMQGCWIAIPFALSAAQLWQNQAYLPPGKYEVEIALSLDNGQGDKCRYKITSPSNWSDLNMIETKR